MNRPISSVVDGEERRTEQRLRSRGEVVLVTRDGKRIHAAVRDISVSGMSVETGCALPLGLPVGIEIHGLGSLGVVRCCISTGSGYHIGMSLHRPAPAPEAPA